MRRVPPPRGDPAAPLRALIFDSLLRPLPRRDPLHPGGGRRGRGPACASPWARTTACTRWPRWATCSSRTAPRTELSAGEVGYLVANFRDVKDTRVGDTILDADRRARAAAARLPRREVHGLRGPLPDRARAVRGPARRAGQAAAQRRLAALRAGDVGRARASASAAGSSACCTWRSCRSGWSASSGSTSSPPCRTWSTTSTSRTARRWWWRTRARCRPARRWTGSRSRT